jgi:hypothetical protein
MAYSISVAVGERDTMALGRDLIMTLPLANLKVTGKVPETLETPNVVVVEAPLETGTNTKPSSTNKAIRPLRVNRIVNLR